MRQVHGRHNEKELLAAFEPLRQTIKQHPFLGGKEAGAADFIVGGYFLVGALSSALKAPDCISMHMCMHKAQFFSYVGEQSATSTTILWCMQQL